MKTRRTLQGPFSIQYPFLKYVKLAQLFQIHSCGRENIPAKVGMYAQGWRGHAWLLLGSESRALSRPKEGAACARRRMLAQRLAAAASVLDAVEALVARGAPDAGEALGGALQGPQRGQDVHRAVRAVVQERCLIVGAPAWATTTISRYPVQAPGKEDSLRHPSCPGESKVGLVAMAPHGFSQGRWCNSDASVTATKGWTDKGGVRHGRLQGVLTCMLQPPAILHTLA